MERITKKMIDIKADFLAKISNQENTPNSEYFLFVDYAPVYGGYRLVSVRKSNGGHYGAFGQSSACSRMNAKEFYMYLSGLIEGIQFKSK